MSCLFSVTRKLCVFGFCLSVCALYKCVCAHDTLWVCVGIICVCVCVIWHRIVIRFTHINPLLNFTHPHTHTHTHTHTDPLTAPQLFAWWECGQAACCVVWPDRALWGSVSNLLLHSVTHGGSCVCSLTRAR